MDIRLKKELSDKLIEKAKEIVGGNNTDAETVVRYAWHRMAYTHKPKKSKKTTQPEVQQQ